ncbi:MAG: 3-deoxy-D-manno-octulosonic acid transferase, partial [Fretibacterium sp.]|nr:3-deoxy-D-manno-octulosonic acid transferase [Fretibacterium sp.]
GVLFDLYSVADAAFVGGSLVEKGGQNPWEPVMFGVPTSHGPSMTDFPDTERMDEMGAARCVHNDSDLAHAWRDALDPAARERARAACQAYCDTLGGAAARTWDVIREYVCA